MINNDGGDRGRTLRNESVSKIHTQLFQEERSESVRTLVGFQGSTGKTVRVTVFWKLLETIFCCQDPLYPKNRDITFLRNVCDSLPGYTTLSALYQNKVI